MNLSDLEQAIHSTAHVIDTRALVTIVKAPQAVTFTVSLGDIPIFKVHVVSQTEVLHEFFHDSHTTTTRYDPSELDEPHPLAFDETQVYWAKKLQDNLDVQKSNLENQKKVEEKAKEEKRLEEEARRRDDLDKKLTSSLDTLASSLRDEFMRNLRDSLNARDIAALRAAQVTGISPPPVPQAVKIEPQGEGESTAHGE